MDYIRFFLTQNPWQQGEKFKFPDFINRQSLAFLQNWLFEKQILTLIGPRQAGKTTLLRKLINELLAQKIPPLSIFYFNFDQEETQEQFQKPRQLFHFIKTRSGEKKIFLFLDEVQRLSDAGLYLKILYDLPGDLLKMIISGSSSLSLKAKTKEYLTGRQVECLLLPLSLKEITQHLNFPFSSPGNQEIVNESLIFGGYPEIFLQNDTEKKKVLLDNLYRDYVKKDIVDFAKIENVAAFNRLTRLLAFQAGNLINFSELAAASGADLRTVQKYLQILEQTFVIKLVPPFFQNRRKEIVKNPKVYFCDNGLRHHLINNFNYPDQRADKGQVLENFVLSELLKILPSDWQIHFWRTQAKAEVDFVLISGSQIVPLEVKSFLKKPALGRSLINFIKAYHPPQAFVFSENLHFERQFSSSKVFFLPLGLISQMKLA